MNDKTRTPEPVHVLNGDVLKEQFPVERIGGKLLVCRECLIEGDVSGDLPEDFWNTRRHHLAQSYPEIALSHDRTCRYELEPLRHLNKNTAVYLWFEDDLFCQVNFWFVVYFISFHTSHRKIYLVSPDPISSHGFGTMDSRALQAAFENALFLDEVTLTHLCLLWKSYQTGDLYEMRNTARLMKEPFPFIEKAVEAHIERIPTSLYPGRPKQRLRQLINELKTTDFAIIFKRFNHHESIYGFGDVQVKRLLEEVLSEQSSES